MKKRVERRHISEDEFVEEVIRKHNFAVALPDPAVEPIGEYEEQDANRLAEIQAAMDEMDDDYPAEVCE